MPLLDSCHFQVAHALQKEGWQVNDRPKYVTDDETDAFIFIDLEAARETNGHEQRTHHIYVEVKCFPGHNASQELYIAVGQYTVYRTFLARQQLETPLYLAVPQAVYEGVFTSIVRQTLRENHIMVIVVDLQTETVVQWIE